MQRVEMTPENMKVATLQKLERTLKNSIEDLEHWDAEGDEVMADYEREHISVLVEKISQIRISLSDEESKLYEKYDFETFYEDDDSGNKFIAAFNK